MECQVADLARIGQLLLNRGAYGDIHFFSAQTFERLMPRPYKEMFPALKDNVGMDRGLGLHWINQVNGLARTEKGVTQGQLIFSKRTIGHGDGYAAVLGMDLANELVVAMTRYQEGQDYEPQLIRFLCAIREGIDEFRVE
jgi:CubicO group peptidase (beta-lactamase class C family)